MSRINIEVPDKYIKVFNMLKISNGSEIKSTFEKASQITTFQYILLEFVKTKKLIHYIDMLEKEE